MEGSVGWFETVNTVLAWTVHTLDFSWQIRVRCKHLGRIGSTEPRRSICAPAHPEEEKLRSIVFGSTATDHALHNQHGSENLDWLSVVQRHVVAGTRNRLVEEVGLESRLAYIE